MANYDRKWHAASKRIDTWWHGLKFECWTRFVFWMFAPDFSEPKHVMREPNQSEFLRKACRGRCVLVKQCLKALDLKVRAVNFRRMYIPAAADARCRLLERCTVPELCWAQSHHPVPGRIRSAICIDHLTKSRWWSLLNGLLSARHHLSVLSYRIGVWFLCTWRFIKKNSIKQMCTSMSRKHINSSIALRLCLWNNVIHNECIPNVSNCQDPDCVWRFQLNCHLEIVTS